MYLADIVHDWRGSVHFAGGNRHFCNLDVCLNLMVNYFGVMQDSHYNTLPKQSLQCCFVFDSAVNPKYNDCLSPTLFMGGINAGHVQLREYPARCWSGARSSRREKHRNS